MNHFEDNNNESPRPFHTEAEDHNTPSTDAANQKDQIVKTTPADRTDILIDPEKTNEINRMIVQYNPPTMTDSTHKTSTLVDNNSTEKQTHPSPNNETAPHTPVPLHETTHPTATSIRENIILRVHELVFTCTDPKKLMDTYESLGKVVQETARQHENLFERIARELSQQEEEEPTD